MSWSMGNEVGGWFIEKVGALFNPNFVVVPKKQLTISATAKENLCIEFVDNAEKIVDQKKKIEDFVATSQGNISQEAAWFLWKCLPLCLWYGASIDDPLSYCDDIVYIQLSKWSDILKLQIDTDGNVDDFHFTSGSIHMLMPKWFAHYIPPTFEELLNSHFNK